MHDITGASVEVDLELPLEPARLWALITDVDRLGEWSPECRGGRWLGDSAKGARFEAKNVYPNGVEGDTLCEVVEFSAPERFGWIVFDEHIDPARPGSRWTYQLSPGSEVGSVRVRHRFEHGAGNTGLRAAIERHPEQAEEIRADRLRELRTNMTVTLRAMTDARS